MDNIDLIVDSALEIITILTDTLLTEEMIFKLVDAGIKLVIGIANGLAQAAPQLAAKIPDLIVTIVEAFASNLPDIVECGKNIVQGIWEGIKAMGAWLWDKVSGFFGDLIDDVEDLLGIHSPSRVFAGIGGNMAKGIGKGFTDEISDVEEVMEKSMQFDMTANANVAYSGPDDSGAAVVERLDDLEKAIMNMRFVLDTGVVAGGVVGRVNEQLGSIYTDDTRRKFA